MDTIVGGIDHIDWAVELLNRGELVAFPTETVYGLGAVATDEEAVKSIFVAKGRPSDNPLIVHVSDVASIDSVARDVPEVAKRLFERFSPGPLTIVLPKSYNIPDVVTAGLDTVGVRIPDHPLALALLARLAKGVAAPSANTSSRVSPSRAIDVYEDMCGKIPLILDGGQCRVGIESTVLDLTKEVPTILRPGGITADMLLEVLPQVQTFSGEIKVAEAPGMKYKHYAPTCECYLVKTVEACKAYVESCSGQRVSLLAMTDFFTACGVPGIDLGATILDMEHNLFAAMRDAEKCSDTILVQYPTSEGVGASVLNRLIKSSAGKILEDK